MVLNPDIDRTLIHRVTIDRPTVTWVHGHQVEAASTFPSTAPQTAVKAHIQPESPAEIARAFGVEIIGDHRAFFNSTVEVEVGNQIIQTAGPSTGTLYWVRAVSPWNDPGGQHLDVALERADSAEAWA